MDTVSDSQALSRYDIQQLALALGANAQDDDPTLPHETSLVSGLQLPQEIVVEFSKWVKTSVSRHIWVEGPPTLERNSALSLAARQIGELSLKLSIPCVAYFFKEAAPTSATKSDSHREAACVEMLYSFVGQLTHLLPRDFRAKSDGELGKTEFQRLDGSLESANVALRMLDTLLGYTTPSLMWIIDGIQLAENSQTVPYLRSFLQMLLLQPKQRMCKVCFTTQGRSSLLMGATTFLERVDASKMALSRPGSMLR